MYVKFDQRVEFDKLNRMKVNAIQKLSLFILLIFSLQSKMKQMFETFE